MAGGERIICASADLVDAGRGVRFEVGYGGETAAAFAIRQAGEVHAYLNRCAHIPMELDWQPGAFFDADGRDLICSTHGATYAADTGQCLGGPCGKSPLVSLRMEESGGRVIFKGIDDG